MNRTSRWFHIGTGPDQPVPPAEFDRNNRQKLSSPDPGHPGRHAVIRIKRMLVSAMAPVREPGVFEATPPPSRAARTPIWLCRVGELARIQPSFRPFDQRVGVRQVGEGRNDAVESTRRVGHILFRRRHDAFSNCDAHDPGCRRNHVFGYWPCREDFGSRRVNSMQPAAWPHVPVRRDKYDFIVAVENAKHEHLRANRANLPGGKIDDG